MRENRSENRLRCPACLALFRTPFECCPADGTALVPAVGDPLIGTEIAGRHIIDERVGEGSMGLIYRAHHMHLPRSFAVKILFGDLVADARMRIRFAQEAALASQLHHPNVISVHDFGRSERGLLYLVMDYIEGESLSAVIAREAPMAPLRAVELARQLAQGLGYAHDNGLVHRDFKPGNVMLERREDGPPVPRILDFGLAISVCEREDMPGRLTEFGYIVGTPIYMAPEQALDRAVDHRADLFALGVVLYEMLAGRPPFDGRPVEIAHKNVSEAPPRIGQRSPGVAVPPELERVVRRLLQKRPADRFDSAADVCAALDAVVRNALEGETQGMEVVDANAPEILSRKEVSDASDDSVKLPDDSENLDWSVGTRRPGRKLAVAASFLFAAGVVVYAMADRAGLLRVNRVEPPVVGEASPVERQPLAGPDAQPDRLGLSAFNPAEPSDWPETPQAGPSEPKLPSGGPGPSRQEMPSDHGRGPGRAGHDRREERPRSAPAGRASAGSKAGKQNARAQQPVLESTASEFGPNGAAQGLTGTAPSAAPRAAGGTGYKSDPYQYREDPYLYKTDPYRSVTQPEMEATDAGVARVPSPAAGAYAGFQAAEDEPPVDKLIHDYREIGEAIARLQARQGEKVTRSFRERYFRIPYGDALRIPAVRRDTLAELAELRQDVMSAMGKVSADPASVPTG